MQFQPGTFQWSYGPKTVFLSIFGHVVTLLFGPQFFGNAWHCLSKSFSLTKVATWCIEWNYGSKPKFAHIWSRDNLNLWPLDLKFSEMLNTAPISLFNWQKLLPGTLKDRVQAPKMCFCPHLVMWWPYCLGLKFSKMLNTAPVNLFHWQKLPPNTFERSYGSKTVILPIYGHMMNLAFDLWTSNFQKCLTLSKKVFLIEWSCDSKTVFGSVFCHTVTLTIDLWTSNFHQWLTLPK